MNAVRLTVTLINAVAARKDSTNLKTPKSCRALGSSWMPLAICAQSNMNWRLSSRRYGVRHDLSQGDIVLIEL